MFYYLVVFTTSGKLLHWVYDNLESAETAGLRLFRKHTEDSKILSVSICPSDRDDFMDVVKGEWNIRKLKVEDRINNLEEKQIESIINKKIKETKEELDEHDQSYMYKNIIVPNPMGNN